MPLLQQHVHQMRAYEPRTACDEKSSHRRSPKQLKMRRYISRIAGPPARRGGTPISRLGFLRDATRCEFREHNQSPCCLLRFQRIGVTLFQSIEKRTLRLSRAKYRDRFVPKTDAAISPEGIGKGIADCR